MVEIQDLIKNKNYEEILKLKGDCYNIYKCISLIKLKRFEEASYYAPEDSFEKAYIFYGLKEFKNCLKILNKIKNSELKFRLLKSQTLYNLGRYIESYLLMKDCPMSEEQLVNLQAVQSLGELANSAKFNLPTKYSIKPKEISISFKEIGKPKFTDKELEEEFYFNGTFKYLIKEEVYVEELKNLSVLYNNIVKNQYLNVINSLEDIDRSKLSPGELQTVLYNLKETSTLRSYLHFYKNILENEGKVIRCNEYKAFQMAKENNYMLKKAIVADSPNLKLLNAFINLKRMFSKQKFTRKYFKKQDESLLWKVVEVLSMKKEDFRRSKEFILKVLEDVKNVNE